MNSKYEIARLESWDLRLRLGYFSKLGSRQLKVPALLRRKPRKECGIGLLQGMRLYLIRLRCPPDWRKHW